MNKSTLIKTALGDKSRRPPPPGQSRELTGTVFAVMRQNANAVSKRDGKSEKWEKAGSQSCPGILRYTSAGSQVTHVVAFNEYAMSNGMNAKLSQTAEDADYYYYIKASIMSQNQPMCTAVYLDRTGKPMSTTNLRGALQNCNRDDASVKCRIALAHKTSQTSQRREKGMGLWGVVCTHAVTGSGGPIKKG
eukprot:2707698-Pyramimonas_sp.AAC.1